MYMVYTCNRASVSTNHLNGCLPAFHRVGIFLFINQGGIYERFTRNFRLHRNRTYHIIYDDEIYEQATYTHRCRIDNQRDILRTDQRLANCHSQRMPCRDQPLSSHKSAPSRRSKYPISIRKET